MRKTRKTLRLPQVQKPGITDPLEQLKLKYPELDHLFVSLAAGRTPNFLEMMAAISELVAFNTKGDSFCDSYKCELEKRS